MLMELSLSLAVSLSLSLSLYLCLSVCLSVRLSVSLSFTLIAFYFHNEVETIWNTSVSQSKFYLMRAFNDYGLFEIYFQNWKLKIYIKICNAN